MGIIIHHLVGGFNPIEKYARQIGSFPQVGVNIKNIWNHQLAIYICIYIYKDPYETTTTILGYVLEN